MKKNDFCKAKLLSTPHFCILSMHGTCTYTYVHTYVCQLDLPIPYVEANVSILEKEGNIVVSIEMATALTTYV